MQNEPKYEEKFLCLLLSDLGVLSTFHHEILASWIEISEYKYILSHLLEHYQTYGSLLTIDAFLSYLKRDFKDDKELQKYKNTFFFLKGFEVTPTEFPFLKEKVVDHFRTREMLLLFKKFLTCCEKEEHKAGFNLLAEKVFTLSNVYRGLYVDRGEIYQEFENRKDLLNKKKADPEFYKGVLTGIAQLDELMGGLWKGEFGLAFGKTNIGKSTLVLQFAKHAYLSGKRVLYITEEMPRLQVALRFDSSFSKIAYSKFKMPQYMSIAEQEQWELQMKGLEGIYEQGARFYIHHIPANCTPSAIMGEVEYLKVKEGKVPDLIIVDDLTMMALPRHFKSREEGMTYNARGLKEVAGVYNTALWATTQGKTTSYRKEVLETDDVAFSVGAIHVADTAVGLQQSEEEKALGRVALHIVKFRDGPVGKKLYLTPDLSKFIIHADMFDEGGVSSEQFTEMEEEALKK